MDISRAAYAYVTYIEPALKVAGFAAIVISVLYIFNSLKDGKKNAEFINTAFNFMVKAIVGLFKYSGLAVVWLGKLLLKIIKVIFASIRDFFTSKI
jgi:hypothetical protein